MSQPRRLYALCSADDGVVVYIGGTTRTFAARRRGHLSAATNDPERPVCAWILGLAAPNKLQIVPLGPGDLAAEQAEIARRVAGGEPLLNVLDGGALHRRKGRPKTTDTAHHNAAGGAGHLPPGLTAAEAAERSSVPLWRVIADSKKAIRPREPLHINEWRDRTAARLAAGPQESEAAA